MRYLASLTAVGSLVAYGAAGAVSAQTSFTITSSCSPNGELLIPALPTTSTSITGTAPSFRATGSTGTDQLFDNWWWYRTTTDTREHAFNSSATSGYQGLSVNGKGDTAVLRWQNVDGKGFDAGLIYRIYSTGATSAVVTETMTIRNPSSSPLAIVLFNYADFDVGGSTNDSSTFVAPLFPPSRQQEITDSVSTVRCYFIGCDVSAYQTGAFSAIRTLLNNAVVDNFNDTGVPFGPGDWSSGYMWRLVVAPQGTASVRAGLAIDSRVPCCDPASVSNYCNGKPGTNGIPTWGDNPMFVGGLTELKVLNGLFGSAPIVLVGVPPQVCVPFGNFGTIAVVPIITTFGMPPFDSTNTSRVCLPVPNNPGLCGFALLLQAWFADAGAAGFPVAHTAGAQFNLGGL